METKSTKILIDAGLSCKQIEQRLSLLNITGDEIDAILITHEHTDHIKGIDVFANRYKTDIYAHFDIWEILDRKLKD